MVEWPRMNWAAIIVVTSAELAFSQQVSGTISGAVADTDGALIQGVHVQIESATLGVLSISQDGHYRFPKLTGGTYWITINADGFERVRFSIDLAQGEERAVPQLRLPRRVRQVSSDSLLRLTGTESGAVAGWVTYWEGSALPAVKARVELICDATVCGQTLSDFDGRFAFSGIRTGKYRVRVELEGFYSEESPELDISAGWEVRSSLALTRCVNGDCWHRPQPHVFE